MPLSLPALGLAHAGDPVRPAGRGAFPAATEHAQQPAHGQERPGVRLVDGRATAPHHQASDQPRLAGVQVDQVGVELAHQRPQAADLRQQAGPGLALGAPGQRGRAGRLRPARQLPVLGTCHGHDVAGPYLCLGELPHDDCDTGLDRLCHVQHAQP